MPYVFPIIIIAEFFVASIMCFVHGDNPRTVFYLLSALININVLFLK